MGLVRIERSNVTFAGMAKEPGRRSCALYRRRDRLLTGKAHKTGPFMIDIGFRWL
jgi:hypothetical protein